MPPRKRGRRDKEAATAHPDDDRDHIGALPDDALHHVLSFLPAQEAVRTCVLARRWRHLWKSSTGLRIVCGNGEEATSVKELREFVHHLLLFRGDSPVDTCELKFRNFEEEDVPRVSLWLRHAVMRKVRVLKLSCDCDSFYRHGHAGFQSDDLPFISQHLTRLKFCSVRFGGSFFSLSRCPVLENLEFKLCVFSEVKKISSESLKNLSITSSFISKDGCRIRIYTPNLVSLHLDGCWEMTPILENMPLLVKAYVRITWECVGDLCPIENYGNCDCDSCDISDNIGGCSETNNSVLLPGLSKAKILVLTAVPGVYIFKRDLRWCPMFSKLKTLLLNEYWCMSDGFRALDCILKHTPVLEKLILQLPPERPKREVQMKGSVSPMDGSAAILEHLREVEIKCKGVNEKVLKVLIFLSAFNIRLIFE